jgi:hypothetical protein
MRTTGPGQSALLLLDAAGLLEGAGVPYAVIGAMAASFHGVVRASLDADALISLPERPAAEEILEKFRRAGFAAVQRKGGPDDPIGRVFVLRDGHGNRVDLLSGLRGADADVFSRAVPASLHGVEIKIAGLEDFIAMKIFAGGPKDMEDVRGALEVSAGKIDRALLKKLVRRYGAAAAKTLSSLKIV